MGRKERWSKTSSPPPPPPQFLTLFALISLSVAVPSFLFFFPLPFAPVPLLNGNSRQSFCGNGGEEEGGNFLSEWAPNRLHERSTPSKKSSSSGKGFFPSFDLSWRRVSSSSAHHHLILRPSSILPPSRSRKSANIHGCERSQNWGEPSWNWTWRGGGCNLGLFNTTASRREK